MRFNSNATVEEVQSICSELAGEADRSRFRGACKEEFGAVSAGRVGGRAGAEAGGGVRSCSLFILLELNRCLLSAASHQPPCSPSLPAGLWHPVGRRLQCHRQLELHQLHRGFGGVAACHAVLCPAPAPASSAEVCLWHWAPSVHARAACLQEDLTAMRRTLGSSVAYFERDRVATVDLVKAIELPGSAGIDAVASVPWG